MENRELFLPIPILFSSSPFPDTGHQGELRQSNRSFGRAGTRLDKACPTQGSVARCRGCTNCISAVSRARVSPSPPARVQGPSGDLRQVALSAASQRPWVPRRRSPGGQCGPALRRQRVPRPKCYAEERSGRCAGGGEQLGSGPAALIARRHGVLAERRDPWRGHGRLPRPAGKGSDTA